MEGWLSCKISLGQFTGEYAIRGILFDGTEFSLFAEKNDLKFPEEPTTGSTVDGRIRVIRGPIKDNFVLVTLPQPTFENGQTITVRTDQVEN